MALTRSLLISNLLSKTGNGAIRILSRTLGRGRGGYDREPRLDLEGITRTLFVKNLPWTIKEKELISAFGCQSVRLPVWEDGRLKGFGYMEFNTPDEASDAFNNMNGTSVQGRDLILDYDERDGGKGGGGGSGSADRPRSDNRGGRGGGRGRGGGNSHVTRRDLEGVTRTLFVGNLPFSIDEDSLRSAFGAKAARLPVRFDGRIKGFGYVDFETADDATNAFNSMSGTAIGGRDVVLDYGEERSDN